MQEFKLQVKDLYSSLSDEELDNRLRDTWGIFRIVVTEEHWESSKAVVSRFKVVSGEDIMT